MSLMKIKTLGLRESTTQRRRPKRIIKVLITRKRTKESSKTFSSFTKNSLYFSETSDLLVKGQAHLASKYLFSSEPCLKKPIEAQNYYIKKASNGKSRLYIIVLS